MATALVPTLVQTVTTNFASVASIAQSITVTNLHDTLIATVWNTGVTSGYAATAVSGAGATWYRLGSVVNATSSGAIDIWAGINASSGAQTVTFTINGTHTAGCNVDEWQNLDNSVLINQPLFTVASSASTGNPAIVYSGPPFDPGSVMYGAIVTTTGTTVSGSPSAPWTNETGPTNSGAQIAAIAWQVVNSVGSFTVDFTSGWNLSGTAQSAWVGVVLRAQQPVGNSVLNDTAVGVNAAVLETQATREYMDDVIAGLAESGTGVISGCSILAHDGASLKYGNMNGTYMINWALQAPIAASYNLSITAADATNPRRDLLYVTGPTSVKYLAGVAAATPCIPTPPIYPFVALAVIDVPANATILDPPFIASPNPAHAQITDKRCLLNYPPSAQDATYVRSGALAETFSRGKATVSNSGVATGTLIMSAIALQAGMPIGHLTAFTGTTALSTPTHYWFALFDSNRNLLAITADQTSTAWGASAEKTLAIATTAEGANSSFVTRYTGLYYFGVMIVASGGTMVANSDQSQLMGLAPALNGTSSGSLTTALTFPFTAAALNNAAAYYYGYVS